MSGERSSVRGDAQRDRFYRQGPSRRTIKFLASEDAKRILFRPSGKEPIHVKAVGRNAPCPCKSGRKFKKCCGGAK
jgi:uncharacterized protein YchJ